MTMVLEHDFDYDPTYGYDLEALLAVAPPTEVPADFEAFWRGTYGEALAVPPRPELREIESPDPGRRVYEIDLDAWGQRRIGGWLVEPVDAALRLGLVLTHGYGGRSQPYPLPDLGVPASVLMPCLRGFHRSAFDDLPDNGRRHVLHGIEQRDTYLHRGCAADVWASVSALLELRPELAGHVGYSGGSFGGGIGALAVPWDPRIGRAVLDIPSFGNHPLRLTLPCCGSGESVRAYHRRHPEVTEVLRYYDAALTAGYIAVPTRVAAAKFDPAVPPPGQFAIYNALTCPKELKVLDYAHFQPPTPWPGNDGWPGGARFLVQGLAKSD